MSKPSTEPGADRTGDGLVDPEVSASYRELATERTPERLDRAVLKAAAVRPEPKPWPRWTRPAAWAATIGLSLAIVLEQTVLNPPSAVFDPTASGDLTELPLQDRAGQTTPPFELPAPATPARRESATRTGSDPKGVSPPPGSASSDRRELVDEQAPTPSPTPGQMPAISSESLAASDTGMLQEAEDRARLHRDTNLPAGTARLRSVVAGETEANLANSFCTPEARASAESWLACILDLERRELHDPVQAEREALAEAFPDFVLPDPR